MIFNNQRTFIQKCTYVCSDPSACRGPITIKFHGICIGRVDQLSVFICRRSFRMNKKNKSVTPENIWLKWNEEKCREYKIQCGEIRNTDVKNLGIFTSFLSLSPYPTPLSVFLYLSPLSVSLYFSPPVHLSTFYTKYIHTINNNAYITFQLRYSYKTG